MDSFKIRKKILMIKWMFCMITIRHLISICLLIYSFSFILSCGTLADLQGDETCEYDYEDYIDDDTGDNVKYDLFDFDDPDTPLKIKDKVTRSLTQTTSQYLDGWKFYKDKENTLDVKLYGDPINGVWRLQGHISDIYGELNEYAKDEKDADNIPHHLLSVGSLPFEPNVDKDVNYWEGFVLGINSYESGFSRNGWSYVFTGDVLRMNKPDFEKEQMLWYVTCHELGHQLADLSHVDASPNEHGQDKDRCFMNREAILNFSGDYKFCEPASPGDPSCDGYLRENLDNTFLE